MSVEDDGGENAPIVDLCVEGNLYPEESKAIRVDMNAVAPNLAEGQQRQLQDF